MSYCTNCGGFGHVFRNCQAPVTSYGIIAIRNVSNTEMNSKLCSMRNLITGMDNANELQFLLIQRRDSLSFIEFVRGKYSITETEYISKLFRNMTRKEQEKIRSMNFDELWNSVWGNTSHTHRNDYENSERKYNAFGRDTILKMLDSNPSEWEEPEWGFPKGRRNPYENDIACAVREFVEETNLKKSDFNILQNIRPLSETFFGSNQVHYCHKYYLAICKKDLCVELSKENPFMAREIGNIQWLTLDEALQKIRPDNVEKREILLKAGRILRNFCPIEAR
jgi:8-oxo-dGTP pyrophosphatase MutT (NUDIX family)